MVETFKLQFKQAMAWMYPQGLRGAYQDLMRALVQSYMLGWMGGLGSSLTGDPLAAKQKELEALSFISRKNWYPDESWKWW